MSRTALWKTDKTRQRCEVSGCPNTAELNFGVCFQHRIIAFNEVKGYDFSWVTTGKTKGVEGKATNE